MKFAALFTAAALVASASGITVNTPGNVIECEPTAITWTGGTAPFFLSFNLQTNPNGDAQQTYANLQSSPFTWSTNITEGTTLVLTLKDSTGATGQSGGFTIGSGSTSCLTSSGSSSAAGGSSSSAGASSSATAASSSASAASSSAGSSASSGASSTAAASSGASSATHASGTSSGAASATSAASGALSNAVNVVLAGVFGAGAVAFLA
ncbi:uncharacterized protein C8Q71DRAFT_751521 [Rhodofomes roseus]|uniref:Uncharacterized protein n=1 Tax=Rhodofomes roseus TaxID=34475 RepID=A0A4Y9YEM0_9APHY|nr:uncharacterized protein C8Q71DRAFT_751521 [Rhodofomes roseus]KAH9838490.1 hypothetical protein C8Q71DRAFT_751521 [Rhodofomes roseus]TFY60450.1 hypothetical protein EVJ58_g5140 [Rhodofomes roseus]